VVGRAFCNMLPSLGKLSLAPDPAPMGEFYALSEQEAAKLNADGGREALTYGDYRPNRARGDEGATFRLFWDQKRVLKNPPGHRTAEEVAAHAQRLYAVYDAKALWDWVKTHDKDPTNSFQISHEDWMQLYAQYGNFGPIPEFVSKLPALEWPDFGPNTVWVYEESGVSPCNNKAWTGGMWKAMVDGAVRFKTFPGFTAESQEEDFLPTYGYYYDGPPGEERITKGCFYGETDFYRGPRGHEQIWKQLAPTGTTRFFATDEEPRASRHRAPPEDCSQRARGRLLYYTTADGLTTWYFKGAKGHERLDYNQTHVPNADVPRGYFEWAYFTGKRDQERVYKVDRGLARNDRLYDTHYLRGANGNEKVYKRVEAGGKWTAYYETGEEHQQALRRVELVSQHTLLGRPLTGADDEGPVHTSTSQMYFEGPRGDETFVRAESTITGPDGYEEQMETELPEDDPDRQDAAQWFYNKWRRKYSAWAPISFAFDVD